MVPHNDPPHLLRRLISLDDILDRQPRIEAPFTHQVHDFQQLTDLWPVTADVTLPLQFELDGDVPLRRVVPFAREGRLSLLFYFVVAFLVPGGPEYPLAHLQRCVEDISSRQSFSLV